MRFFLTRIIKNFPFFYKYWQMLLGNLDFAYYEKNCKNYKIVPFGCYCFPRVITTINRLKPTKKFGEETFPFDLCFSDFDSNVKFLSENFKNFYDDIEFDHDEKCWINKKYNLIFNHDNMPIEEFKKRYNNRIRNLYATLNNKEKYVFFLVATFYPIENKQAELFIKEVLKYRDADTFCIIIINLSNQKIQYKSKNVVSIDLSPEEYNKINRNNDWLGQLVHMRSISARRFNAKVYSSLSEIIKSKI